MSQNTALNAPTQYITASNGTNYAYRHLGGPLTSTSPPPLVMHIHFRANMDLWDPLLLSTLSAKRPILIFDQPGIGRTPGTVPTTYQGWADDLITLIDTLGVKKFDLLGFSMGGIAVQHVALTRPDQVRRLILAGTTASIPQSDYDRLESVVKPRDQYPPEPIKALAEAETLEEGKKALEYSFFYETEHGRAAFAKYWSRVNERNVEGEDLKLKLNNIPASKRQVQAAEHSQTPNPDGSFDRLGELKMPVLVANGDFDVLWPSSRSWELYRYIENTQLVMYPKAGHGFLWQYAEAFGRDINNFLDSEEWEKLPVAKL